MKWIAAHPDFVDLWFDDLDPADFVVEEYDNVQSPIEIARVLLGQADPGALARFDRVYDGGFDTAPPHWAGERLIELRDALAAIPDTRGPHEGFWRLDEATLAEVAPKLPWTKQYAGKPAELLRESVWAEWNTARTLHAFADRAVSSGLVIIWD